MSIGLLLLRIAVGLTLAAHGSQKLFGWFGGSGVDGTARAMEHLGFVPGRRSAVMAGLTEAGGGILLALGAATPVAAAVLLGVMVVAMVSAHLKQGFFVSQGGFEYPLLLGLAALSVAFTGPGPLSVDAALGFDLSGAAWGWAALLVGLAGAFVQLASRRPVAAQPQAKTQSA
jgi:putative oxidoreductase